MRRAEDEDKRRKLSCTRCAVSCAGCAMDEAQREVRARSAGETGDFDTTNAAVTYRCRR